MSVIESAVLGTSVKLCIVYHSAYGHTEKVAQHIAQGAEFAGAEVIVMPVSAVQWEALDVSDIIIMGCPTYMGSLTAELKLFMLEKQYWNI